MTPTALLWVRRLGAGFEGGSQGLEWEQGEPWCLGPSSDEPLLSAAGEDARIRLWRVPPEGLEEVLTIPEAVLTGQVGPSRGREVEGKQ